MKLRLIILILFFSSLNANSQSYSIENELKKEINWVKDFVRMSYIWRNVKDENVKSWLLEDETMSVLFQSSAFPVILFDTLILIIKNEVFIGSKCAESKRNDCHLMLSAISFSNSQRVLDVIYEPKYLNYAITSIIDRKNSE